MPNSSPLEVKVLSALVKRLSPSKKKNIFSDARKEWSFTPGWPSKVLQNKNSIIAFLELPDINYCAPSRKDTAYSGKSSDIKIYQPKHYLLYTYNKLLSLFNEENEAKVSYSQVREIIASEKDLVMQGNTPEDDCRCETCENSELFLQSTEVYFNKEKQKDLVSNLPTDSMVLVELGVCSVRSIDCMKGQCDECPGKKGGYQHLWRARKSGIFIVLSMGKSPKVCSQNTGWSNWRGSSNSLADLVDGNKMKMHKYNIYRQLSELKCLKMSLKEDELILSVDFSKNYENKQCHEIQSAYFGHKNFTFFTAPFSLLEWWLCWPVPVSIRVSFFLLLSSQSWELGKKCDSNFTFTFAMVKVRYGSITMATIFKHGNYLKYLLIFCFLLLDCFYTCLFFFTCVLRVITL